MKKISLEKDSFVFTYLATLLVSFHYYLVTYVNSSFLTQYVGTSTIGILYTAGAILNIIFFFAITKFLRKYGDYKVMLFCLGLEGLSLLSMATLKNISWLAPAFILHDAINPMLLVCLDIFLEHYSKNEKTGAIRGFFLTVISLTAVISPLLVGTIIQNGGFSRVYFASVGFIVLLFLLVARYFKDYKDREYHTSSPLKILDELVRSRPIRQIFASNLMLQIFYSWMTVYIPIYLAKYIGFGWGEIGLIISISILPFVFFEFPLGEIADKKLGEKEILLSGFAIMVSGLLLIGEISAANTVLWILAIGIARIGACFVEVSTETYFFKNINSDNNELINFWRMTNPLGYILGTILGGICLIIMPFQYAFFVLAGVIVLGFIYATRLKDTK